MADNMSIDKKESHREGSEDSMELNTPTPEAETGGAPQPEQQQKRKGGRKPVHCTYPTLVVYILTAINRYTPRPKSANNATGRLKQHFENVGLNTLSNWKRPSGCMKRTCTTCKLLTGAQPTNVLC